MNSEKEIDHTGDDMTGFIAEELADRDAAISMEVRPFGAVDWHPLAYPRKYPRPVLPQNFPGETGIGDTDQAIRQNWWNAGMRCVVITYGSYGTMDAGDFDRLSPFGVYTADDCGNDFKAWASLGTCEPCSGTPAPPDGGDGMPELIGYQHGIEATYNRFKALDPAGANPAFDPADYDALRPASARPTTSGAAPCSSSSMTTMRRWVAKGSQAASWKQYPGLERRCYGCGRKLKLNEPGGLWFREYPTLAVYGFACCLDQAARHYDWEDEHDGETARQEVHGERREAADPRTVRLPQVEEVPDRHGQAVPRRTVLRRTEGHGGSRAVIVKRGLRSSNASVRAAAKRAAKK